MKVEFYAVFKIQKIITKLHYYKFSDIEVIPAEVLGLAISSSAEYEPTLLT